jgi:RHS repeat-associated protein
LVAASLLPSSTTLSAADPANRIAQAGADTFSFDAEGQTISRSNRGTSQYLFDARGRLTQVTLADGQTVSYQYDGLGRRVSRTANGTTMQFLYDSEDVVQDINSDGSTVDYLNGPGIDQKLRQVSSATNGPLYFLQDHLSSTVALTDRTGGVAESEQYAAYGGGKGSNLTRYLYTGRELDQQTGLYFYRARYYDPAIGRFISEDPIGFDGGMNFYAYAGNDPAGFTDPLGLCPPQKKKKCPLRLNLNFFMPLNPRTTQSIYLTLNQLFGPDIELQFSSERYANPILREPIGDSKLRP